MGEKYKMYSKREWNDIMKSNGYHVIRQTGSHNIWHNDTLNRSITMPYDKINPMIARRLIKEYKLTL